ncbi:diaminopropionate ammonia-lyase [Nonomuraea jiangxiensis]|uniref:Diaminopropionate ammonia-lyase n=1 Tax=Nonomuraea jiangxiensis TaxID=633440 RepID=A0A1G8DH29_9ACTN|nr:diaminopropionate ammonia-lyase [Nonomuraea jiangxiensis]SDH56924.1 diaminopropionate ammonia-lyase [Nonomuraea jiangxiensis]
MYLNPEARSHSAPNPPPPGDGAARTFHAGLPGYAPTPLTELPELATELGVGRLLVKDESSRLGLPAFKILGASWAVALLLADRFGLAGPLDLERLRTAAAREPVVLVTATDGNHGRALARMARLVGAHAVVFVPDVLEHRTVDLIAGEGAEIEWVDGDYDEAVRRAAKYADRTGAELVQDTAWDGYERVPAWIVDGYRTLLAEIDERVTPDLVVVPAGVGSLAQAVVTHYRGRAHVVTAEPDSADCVRRSLLAGRPVRIRTGVTSMAGLNCGTPSSAAWPYLLAGLSGAVAVGEEQDAAAVADLARLGVAAGPCGAAALAGARLLPLDRLGLDHTATVVLICTDGAQPLAPAHGRT